MGLLRLSFDCDNSLLSLIFSLDISVSLLGSSIISVSLFNFLVSSDFSLLLSFDFIFFLL